MDDWEWRFSTAKPLGIVDYDGSWINAGTNIDNKFVEPGNPGYTLFHCGNNE